MPNLTDDEIDAMPPSERLALRLALRAWERRTLAYAADVGAGYKAPATVIDTVYAAVDWTDPVVWRDVPTYASDWACL